MFCLTETNSNFFQISCMGCWGFNWTPPILHPEQVLNVIIRQAVAWVVPGRMQICRAGSQVLLWVSLSSLCSPPASLSSLAKMISSWQLFMSVTSLGQTLINWPSVKGIPLLTVVSHPQHSLNSDLTGKAQPQLGDLHLAALLLQLVSRHQIHNSCLFHCSF